MPRGARLVLPQGVGWKPTLPLRLVATRATWNREVRRRPTPPPLGGAEIPRSIHFGEVSDGDGRSTGGTARGWGEREGVSPGPAVRRPGRPRPKAERSRPSPPPPEHAPPLSVWRGREGRPRPD